MFRKMCLTMAIFAGLAMTLGILVFLNPAHAHAAASVLYVGPAGDCGDASPCYADIQSALGAALPEDIIKVATGVYTGVHAYTNPYYTDTLLTQMAYITKSITLIGGYTHTNWSSPDPAAYPVTLDAQELGRVIYITGTIQVEVDGFRLINGNGGVYIGGIADVEIRNSLIQKSRNFEGHGYDGHGITNYGTLELVDSSVVSTTAGCSLCQNTGIENLGTTDIYSATIRNNMSAYGCPGILNEGVMNVYTTTIENNHGGGIKSVGGGICNWGTFYLSGSSVLNNFALLGGGIANTGIMNILNTTISGNKGNAPGNGILNYTGYPSPGIAPRGLMTITNSLIISNTSFSLTGNGINNSDIHGSGITPTLYIQNTIVAFNADANCYGVLTSLGHNLEAGNSCGFNSIGDLIDTDPGLGPLGYYGGPTLTYSLEPGSPAIDAGDNLGCPPIDQRGVHRPQGAVCDIGAFELPKLFLPILLFLE